VFLKRDELAARDGGAGFINQWLRPSKIVAFYFTPGNALADKLARCTALTMVTLV